MASFPPVVKGGLLGLLPLPFSQSYPWSATVLRRMNRRRRPLRAGFLAQNLQPGSGTAFHFALAIDQTVKFEAGKVSFVRQAFTPELEAEFLSVPNSRHDDLVDSICQAWPTPPMSRPTTEMR